MEQTEQTVKMEQTEQIVKMEKTEQTEQTVQMEQTVKMEHIKVELKQEHSAGKLEVKMVMTDTVVEAVESGPVEFAMVDTTTGFCHGIANIAKVEEDVKIVAGKRRKYYCDSCSYSTKDKYMITRHISRIHQKSLATKQCRFCEFTTIYPSNLTRHMHRAHSSQDSDS